LRNISLFAAVILAALPGFAQPLETDLEIGKKAPSFTLKDQNDNTVTLDALLRKGPVALVFLRSAEWCSYCQFQVIQIQQNIKEIESAGGTVVAISYDDPQKVKTFASRHKISMPILSDPDSKIIDAYHMRSQAASGHQEGCSKHGTFILDKNGVVRSKPYLVSTQPRPVVEALLGGLKEAQKSLSDPNKDAGKNSR
jgi:peroxiredoxin